MPGPGAQHTMGMAQNPDGDPAPADGALPGEALAGLGTRPFGVYVHVPFCAARCGYCDFNTYVPGEDGGADRDGYLDAALAEVRLARRVLGDRAPRAQTVFFGGGTPSLLAPSQLQRLLEALADAFGLADGAEITLEANPESVDPARLRALHAAGFNRISLGMQSQAAHVLSALDRRHAPGRPVAAAHEARASGFTGVNLDLIYGTPGETDADWEASLRAVLDAGADHVSAYALTVEPGTRLAARVRRGDMAAPDDDVLADRYRIADELLSSAGLPWYEISNWASSPATRSRHNLGYWHSGDWWGIGPGAHSHVGGVRWWNLLHPRAYAERLAGGDSPAAGRELLTEAQRRTERLMLEVRLVEGLALHSLDPVARDALAEQVAAGRLELREGRAVLTLEGRLMADAVARALTG